MRHKQFKKEDLLARYFIYLETHVKRVVNMRKFCAMLWNKNLVLAVSRIKFAYLWLCTRKEL